MAARDDKMIKELLPGRRSGLVIVGEDVQVLRVRYRKAQRQLIPDATDVMPQPSRDEHDVAVTQLFP